MPHQTTESVRPEEIETNRPTITAFFPAYNEQDNIARVIDRTSAVLWQISQDYEIIIVDDGSTDRTPEIVARMSEYNPKIRLVRHETNRGYGAALASGFAAAKMEWIFFTDSDGQFDVAEIEKFLPFMPAYDLVIGYRIKRADNTLRKFNSWAWKTLVINLFRLHGVRDIDCGFKIVRRQVFQKFRLQTTGAMISTELLVKAQKNGFKIAEVGVNHYPRTAGKPTGAKLDVIFRAFRELFYYYNEWQKFGYK